MLNTLKVSCIAEKALIYLFSEENIISAEQMAFLAGRIGADTTYINQRLVENRKMQLGTALKKT
jgi:thymidine kinase